MNFSIYIAKKYFLSIRKQKLISVVTLMSTAGIFLGTMSLIVVMSVFNGFDNLVQNIFINLDPDIKIEKKNGLLFDENDKLIDEISNLAGVENVSIVLENKLLATQDNYQLVINAKGVSKSYNKVTRIENEIVFGNYLKDNKSLLTSQLVFNSLSTKLLDFKSPLKLTFFDTDKKIFGSNNFISKSFYIIGVFSGESSVGNGDIIMPIHELQKLTKNQGKISSIVLSVRKNNNKVHKKIKDLVGPNFLVSDRSQQRPFVNKMIKSEKLVVYLIFSFILIISILGLVASIVILMIKKNKDFVLLKSLGLEYKKLKKIFFTLGLMVTTFGLFSGTIFGLFFCYLQQKFKIIGLGASNFPIQYYPVKIEFTDILIIQLIVIFFGTVGSLIVSKNNQFYRTNLNDNNS